MEDEILVDVDLAFRGAKEFHEIHIQLSPFPITQSLVISKAACTDYDLTGEVLWPMSHLMAKFLISHPVLVHGKDFLELGCGAGLPSFVALQLGAQHIHLTDGEPSILELSRQTIETIVPPSVRHKCSSAVLKWGGSKTYDVPPFDVLIGSDLIYWESAISPLFETLRSLMMQSPNATCYIAYLSRAKVVDRALIDKLPLYGLQMKVNQTNTNVFCDELTEASIASPDGCILNISLSDRSSQKQK